MRITNNIRKEVSNNKISPTFFSFPCYLLMSKTQDKPQRKDSRDLGSMNSAEHQRLRQCDTKEKHWKKWGPYVSERQWSTVREDYSYDGK